ncbi:uncharacterized protein LOC115066223 [Bactrocera dorsalis]|uniref:Uncharacterized protein LOC115066223 n=1 Tax=Bactrocera dorsalis TaxID=27457 RepID=A0A8N4L614_BACDO|nr:uncharacterized protein LOC115066223 [Bactrocera dorsalis]
MGENIEKSTLPYQLFLYNEELRRPNPRVVRRIKSKVELTEKLINENMKNLDNYGGADLMAINRQVDFKEELTEKIEMIKECHKTMKSQKNPSTWL